MILGGDVGATKTELAIFKYENGNIVKRNSELYVSRDFKNLDDIIELFIKSEEAEIDSACIGLPGPVDNGRSKLTNLNWCPDEKLLSEKFNIKKFKLVNDLEAIAAAILNLDPKDFICLNSNKENNNVNKVIIAPGTGLGQAALIFDGEKYIVTATEGGHTDFAPQNKIEIELLEYLQQKYEHVSYERVISGMGILNIFNFLMDTGKCSVDSELLNEISNGDPSAVISKKGISGKSEICRKTMDIFASVLGAQAGNMVLNYKATGGVYLAGGIPVKIFEKLKDGIFMESFSKKGRLSFLTEDTPVYILRNESAGTTGAAIIASGL